MTLFTVFAVVMTLVLLSAASSFRSVSDSAEERFSERTPLLYVAQKIRGFDRSGAVKLDRIDEADVLVLREEYYDVLIYERDGFLCELFVLHGNSPDLRLGAALFPVQGAGFELVTHSLVRVTANGKSVYVSLMSEVSP
jgi:hypothetical protein